MKNYVFKQAVCLVTLVMIFGSCTTIIREEPETPCENDAIILKSVVGKLMDYTAEVYTDSINYTIYTYDAMKRIASIRKKEQQGKEQFITYQYPKPFEVRIVTNATNYSVLTLNAQRNVIEKQTFYTQDPDPTVHTSIDKYEYNSTGYLIKTRHYQEGGYMDTPYITIEQNWKYGNIESVTNYPYGTTTGIINYYSYQKNVLNPFAITDALVNFTGKQSKNFKVSPDVMYDMEPPSRPVARTNTYSGYNITETLSWRCW